MLTFKRLESGYWHIRGDGPCNWAQVPLWPCSVATLRAHAFPEASEAFFDELRPLCVDYSADSAGCGAMSDKMKPSPIWPLLPGDDEKEEVRSDGT